MRRYSVHRFVEKRSTLPVVYVICDDTETARNYFNHVKKKCEEYCSIQVFSAPCHGATGEAVIQAALSISRNLNGKRNSKIFALIDLEGPNSTKQAQKSIRDKAAKGRIEVIFSKPCFEVWILQHFMKTGEFFAQCQDVLPVIKKHWKKSFKQDFPKNKGQADYRLLMERMKAATEHARSQDIRQSQSWTEIWKITQHILQLSSTDLDPN